MSQYKYPDFTSQPRLFEFYIVMQTHGIIRAAKRRFSLFNLLSPAGSPQQAHYSLITFRGKKVDFVGLATETVEFLDVELLSNDCFPSKSDKDDGLLARAGGYYARLTP